MRGGDGGDFFWFISRCPFAMWPEGAREDQDVCFVPREGRERKYDNANPAYQLSILYRLGIEDWEAPQRCSDSVRRIKWIDILHDRLYQSYSSHC